MLNKVRSVSSHYTALLCFRPNRIGHDALIAVDRLSDGLCLALRRERKGMASWMKKRSERRKHCALAVVRRSRKFSPAADPLPGVRDGQNLISWRWSLPFTYKPSFVRIDARNFALQAKYNTPIILSTFALWHLPYIAVYTNHKLIINKTILFLPVDQKYH